MKARICYTETGTGEKFTLDAELDDLSVASVIKAINQDARTEVGEEWQDIVPVATGEVKTEDQLGFVFRDDSQKYFGPMIYAGVVYTL